MRPSAFHSAQRLLLSIVVAAAGVASARVVSYAPVTSRLAIPAVKDRAARHYVLFELQSRSLGPAQVGIGPGLLYLYDARAEEEPRLLLAGPANVSVLAVWERAGAKPVVFLGTDARLDGDNVAREHRYLLSTDGGDSWKVVPLPKEAAWDTLSPYLSSLVSTRETSDQDIGGPLVRGRRSPVRLGPVEAPFVFLARNGDLWAILPDAKAKLLVREQAVPSPGPPIVLPAPELIGSDAEGKRLLWTGSPVTATTGPQSSAYAVYMVDLAGGVAPVLSLPSTTRIQMNGWITPSGAVYLELEPPAVPGPMGGVTGTKTFGLVTNGVFTEVARPLPGAPGTGLSLFAVPTADFGGAWILQRGAGLPTVLSLHRPGGPMVEQWRDITGPAVEALHAGRADGGKRLLVQVNRPRPQSDQRIFIDPALAIWGVGEPAPRRYDELFLNELGTKGFVTLDVDAAAAGEPFVFDSGSPIFVSTVAGGPSGGGAGGGADVTQEWGVVRASLRQRLVIPAVARSPGRNGSFWKTDVLLRNPDPDALALTVRYLPAGEVTVAVIFEKSLTLAPNEIRVLPDVLNALFGLPQGSGALLISPEGDRSLEATSRTYTASPKGTYGMGLGALDVFTAFGQNFEATFASGLPGAGFRSNLVLTNVGPRPAEVLLRLQDEGSPQTEVSATAPALGQVQLPGLADWMGTPAWQTAALVLSPRAGEVLPALTVIDEKTNDPTYFPPDLPSSFLRVIPALVHEDGSGGARYRSDLFVFNPSSKLQTLTLAVKLWTQDFETVLNLALLPRESRVIRDVLQTAFGRTGVARLRFQSSSLDAAESVRVTSRTYTVDADGGTYGLLIPPLNAFQSAGGGETLEILGAQGGPDRRTNLALVELTSGAPSGGPQAPQAPRAKVEVLDEQGALRDAFEVTVPWAGGVQLNDVFRARGLGDGPKAALIRISPSGGLVGAYATLIDSGTNDPTYLPASLGARD